MSSIVLNVDAIIAAAASIGISDNVEDWLGIRWCEPVTMLVLATILQRVPIQAGTAFTIT